MINPDGEGKKKVRGKKNEKLEEGGKPRGQGGGANQKKLKKEKGKVGAKPAKKKKGRPQEGTERPQQERVGRGAAVSTKT